MRSEPIPAPFLSFDSAAATLENVGGKALNLSKLAQAGFSVPDGFFIPTVVYGQFVSSNELAEQIRLILEQADLTAPVDLAQASSDIKALFAQGTAPDGLAADLDDAWLGLGGGPVAVRSSATAEDLPGLSFAGQQDTFLNVTSGDALLAAVVACWSSLWTARAIGYRHRNGVSQCDVALAVVVQNMVQSESSGVLFTANPLSGLRSETVIDATFGLGEALVGGHVEPDHYVVNTPNRRITAKHIGKKALVISSVSAGGVIAREASASQEQALTDDIILELAGVGSAIEQLYDYPQDVEWALAEDRLYILQSRPITSLFPLPDGLPAEPLRVFFSFAAVQGVLDPITPLGCDALREVFAAGGRLFGISSTRDTQKAVYEAGQRLWVNFTPLIKNSFGRRLTPTIFRFIEPTAGQAIGQLWNDPRLQPGPQTFSLRTHLRLARFIAPVASNLVLNLIAPQARREMVVDHGEHVLRLLEQRCESIQGDEWERLYQRAGLLPEFAARYFPKAFRLFVSVVAAGMASWNVVNRLAVAAAPQSEAQPSERPHDLALQMTRGMPHNPTTEMDLALWKMAKLIRSDQASAKMFHSLTAAELSAKYRAGDLPPVTMRLVAVFLGRYGARGLAEIDLGRTRWADDPTYVFESLSRYLTIADDELAPDVVFSRGAASAEWSIDQLAELLRQSPGGWFKAPLVRFFSGRARQLMGTRETPKFFAVRVFHLVQRELLKSGAALVAAGELNQPDDLFYLTLTELKCLAARESRDWAKLIADRRETYQRETLRRQIPRLLVSDGRAFYDGMVVAESVYGELVGSPVSPGTVEGRVRIVLDPTGAALEPGEIMVCPGTDPSWTPLFLAAGGLVMEVGGMMTHGAVVAREYGIPAVVGVNQATTRLVTGQQVRVDGSSGLVAILDEQVPSRAGEQLEL